MFSRVLAVFLLLNHAHSCHWFVRPGLVNLQALHQPTALLRRQLSHLFSVPRPLEAPVLQPFVQQHKAVTFPVQRFDPVTPPPAEQEQRIGKRVKLELALYQRRQPIDSLAQVRVPAGYVHLFRAGEVTQHDFAAWNSACSVF